MRFGLLAACAALVISAARGQSLNVDLNRTTGAGAGAPANAFAGAADQTGVWTAVPIGSGIHVLAGLNGANSGVTLTWGGNGTGDADSLAGASADYGKLLWDYSRGYTQLGEIECTLNGLDPGMYRVVIYAYLPGESGYYMWGTQKIYHKNYISVTRGVQVVGYAQTSGAAAVNQFVEGVTHAVIDFTVPAGAPAVTLRVATDAGYSSSYCAFNGFQLVQYTADRLYVDASATAGANHGRNWANAMTDLQDALQFAAGSGGQIKELWVADGTYEPTAGTERGSSFNLPNNLRLIGGFVGGETDIQDRDPWIQRAYLSGNIGGGGATDNSYHVVNCSGTSRNTVLDGFWITSGRADGTGGSGTDRGGALYASGGSPTVRDCVFIGNWAAFGGGVNIETGAPTFEGCTFINNVGQYGPGHLRYIDAGAPLESDLLLYNCRFLGGTAEQENGGALYIFGGDALIANCLFDGGRAQTSGGGIIVRGNTANVQIYHTTIVSCRAHLYAGGLSVEQNSVVNVANSILWGNTSDTQSSTFFSQVWTTTGGTVEFAYSCVQTEAAVPAFGPGNIKADPLFRNRLGANGLPGDLDNDLRLGAGSAAIDAGSNALMALDYLDLDDDGNTGEAVPLDLDWLTRRVDDPATPDTGQGTAPLIDMGAYEFTRSLAGDLNCDGLVDFDDINPFVHLLSDPAGWHASHPGCPATNGDINADGQVNFADINAFVALLSS